MNRVIENDLKERNAQVSALLKSVLISIITILTVYMIVRMILAHFNLIFTDYFLSGIILLMLGVYIIFRKQYITLASILVVTISFLGMTVIAFLDQGVRDTSVIVYAVIIVFATLLLGKPAAIVTSGLSIIAVWLMVYIERIGILVYEAPEIDVVARDLTLVMVLTAALSLFYSTIISKYVKEINHSKQMYLEINDDLIKSNSEILKINQELKSAKEKAEESDKLKSSFLANLSHEIRTPMNGIIGFSELVVSPGISNEDREKYNSIIAQSCKQLLGVVNDIIDISKIESGIIELHNEPYNLNLVLYDLFNLYSLNAETKGLKLVLETGLSNSDAVLVGDEVKIRQILSNLIGNAIKFTEKGEVLFGYLQEKNKLHFYVKDTGIGIHQDHVDKIFDRFIQEDMKISREFGGTGLGLSIARAFVEKMGGSISVSSELGKGSHFTFEIPCEKHENQKISAPGNQLLQEKAAKNILIVEDIEVNEILLVELLKKYNLNTVSARTGEEALELFNSEAKLDLIFMDIKLPGIDGLEVSRRIRNQNRKIPIIAQTAYAFSEDRDKALNAGCNDIISKPITRDSIEAIVREYLR